MELDFLNLHAEPMAIERVRSEMLQTLPDQKEDVLSMKAAVEALEKIGKSRLCLAFDPSLEDDCATLKGLVQRLMEGHPPSEKLITCGSGFFRDCITKMGNWCSVESKKRARRGKTPRALRSSCMPRRPWRTCMMPAWALAMEKTEAQRHGAASEIQVAASSREATQSRRDG